MASIVIAGDTSGTCTISAPAVAGTPTLTLPTTTGTILTSASTGISASNITTGTLPYAQLPTGSVLQVVQVSTSSTTTVTGGALVATSLAATITPKFSTSKILILVTASISISRNSQTDAGSGVGIYRNGSQVFADNGMYVNFYYNSSSINNLRNRTPLNYLDSPASTSALTYTFYLGNYVASTAALNTDSQFSFITLLEVAA